MTLTPAADLQFCLRLTQAIGRTRGIEEIYEVALDALAEGVGMRRAAILLMDADGVMRFKASRGLSPEYQQAVEGHSPWAVDATDAEPIVIPDVTTDASVHALLPAIRAERIAAMAFIPLVEGDRLVGKFMLYYDHPHMLLDAELALAGLISAQVGFALGRTRAEIEARRSEERLRFALDAAMMGTWEWDLRTQEVRWSDNLARIHGLPDGAFDGTFASYAREIHPEDRERVLESARRAVTDGVPHDVEYRLVAPDGTVRWCEGKGLVEYDSDGRPVRMAGVCVIVTRRKQAELERLESAEEANRLKDDFLATLSHELRTPLNAIVGWTRMLQAAMLPADRIPGAIDIISRNAQLQSKLIEDILDVSRIIAGKLEIESVPLPIAPILESAMQTMALTAAEKEVRLNLECVEASPLLAGDPRRLEQVFNNLLSNAIRFSEPGAAVSMRCVHADGHLQVEVSDTGLGIDPEFLPFIFERFRQGDSSTTRPHGGLGLGLAIARYIVEQHGGAMSAESPGLGHGTTVRVRLPVSS
jgi:PAS domain S-box-containing protein